MILKILGKTFLVTLAVIFIFVSFCYALETGTHEAINEYVARNTIKDFSLESYLKNQLGIQAGVKEIVDSQYIWWWIRKGGLYEDKPPRIIPYTRSMNHFHDPLIRWDNAGFKGNFKSAVLWSQDQGAFGSLWGGDWSWKKVRNSFYKGLTDVAKTDRENDFADTFRALGQIMHLVEDVSVPAHTRNDAHVVGYHYELAVDKFRRNGDPTFTDALARPTTFDPSILSLTPNPLASIPIAKIFDIDKYNMPNPDPNVTVGNAIGLSEYTNANFVSEGLLSANFQDFPLPRMSDTSVVGRSYLGPSGAYTRQYYAKNCCGETNAGKGYLLATVDYLDYWRQKHPILSAGLPKIPGLDDNVYKDYASLLIPRAVGYSAGLLNYFFRGDMDMVPDDATGSGYLIVNNTDEDMNGTFELYYDNNSNERIKINGWSLSIGKQSSGNDKSTNITFTKPANMKEDGKYMLVFRGKLGNEDDAVAGRQVELKGGEYVFLVSAAPYGRNDKGDRIFITVITMFKMNIANNKYELIPVDTFEIDGEMYFDGMKTTSLIINSNDAKNYHIINYTMDDEESNVLWSEKLENYGAATIDGAGNKRPPKGSYHAYLDAYLAYWKYPWTTWASGRRTSNVVWRDYKGNLLGFRYSGGNYLEDTGEEWYLGPHLSPFIEGSPEVTRHEVIARTENKTIYIKRDSDISREDSHFHCEYIDLLNRTVVYDYDLMRLVWSGQMKIFFGDTLIKTLDYYGRGRWDCHAYFLLSGDCLDAYDDTYVKEYVITYPSGGRSISAFVSDKQIDIIDYDNINDNDLFILFYSIRDYRGYGYPIEYFLAYKTQKDSNLTEVSIFKGRQSIDRLYGVSSQLNKDGIVYSYHVQHTSTPWPPEWKDEKFIMGIINIADNKFPVGHRQEFEYFPIEEHSAPVNVRLSPATGGTLSPGTYTYYITAVNPCNQTLASVPATITLNGDETAVKIEWDGVAGASHYIIYGRNGDSHALAIVGGTIWSDAGIDSGLNAGVINSSLINPWRLPENPIKPFLSAIGVHKKKD